VVKKKRELEEQIKNLNGSLQKIKVEAKNYVITAPLSGTIEISQNSGRFFFECFAAHCTISATDKLIVESSVSPNDIGLIQTKVKIQIDAFNYNQWDY
jgi:HlyD family secretion protein